MYEYQQDPCNCNSLGVDENNLEGGGFNGYYERGYYVHQQI